uniref:Uncharacterized protein n=1 Tax=Parascaris univalens TaxID=6257 RepID=A0A915BSU5_PARUN
MVSKNSAMARERWEERLFVSTGVFTTHVALAALHVNIAGCLVDVVAKRDQSRRKWSALCSMAIPFLAAAFCLRIGPDTEREHVMCADVKRPSRQAVVLRRVRSCSRVVNAFVECAAACHQRPSLGSAVARVWLHVVSICCGHFAFNTCVPPEGAATTWYFSN